MTIFEQYYQNLEPHRNAAKDLQQAEQETAAWKNGIKGSITGEQWENYEKAKSKENEIRQSFDQYEKVHQETTASIKQAFVDHPELTEYLIHLGNHQFFGIRLNEQKEIDTFSTHR